mmetsp:Transcript_24026/g.81174  ORF Transcript_24026/g.81174 Transcript_24026/m.81174 type:complete len:367 (-) Transcript_24026:206-1306(-)
MWCLSALSAVCTRDSAVSPPSSVPHRTVCTRADQAAAPERREQESCCEFHSTRRSARTASYVGSHRSREIARSARQRLPSSPPPPRRRGGAGAVSRARGGGGLASAASGVWKGDTEGEAEAEPQGPQRAPPRLPCAAAGASREPLPAAKPQAVRTPAPRSSPMLSRADGAAPRRDDLPDGDDAGSLKTACDCTPLRACSLRSLPSESEPPPSETTPSRGELPALGRPSSLRRLLCSAFFSRRRPAAGTGIASLVAEELCTPAAAATAALPLPLPFARPPDGNSSPSEESPPRRELRRRRPPAVRLLSMSSVSSVSAKRSSGSRPSPSHSQALPRPRRRRPRPARPCCGTAWRTFASSIEGASKSSI